MEEKTTYIDDSLVRGWLQKRKDDATKHSFGHALLIAGGKGKMGAAVLCSLAALRSGCGLLTVHIPSRGESILQASVPEAMVSLDSSIDCFSVLPDLNYFTSIGIGPGLGKDEKTKQAIMNLLLTSHVPLVIDADAINCLSENEKLIENIPANSVLTPHSKEFERLLGVQPLSMDAMQIQREWSIEKHVIIVRKAHQTVVTCPEGQVFINTTGNPGLAKAGTGDLLTGIITSFIAQGYSPLQSALLGVYIHGKAADLAVKTIDEKALLASDVIEYISAAFREVGVN